MKEVLADNLLIQSRIMLFLQFQKMIARNPLMIEPLIFYVLKMVILEYLNIFSIATATNDIMEWLIMSLFPQHQKVFLLVMFLFYIPPFLEQRSFCPNISIHCFFRNLRISLMFKKLYSNRTLK